MRTTSKLLALACSCSLLGGCEADIVGPGSGLLSGLDGDGTYGSSPPALQLWGQVDVGGYLAQGGEATIYFYAASNATHPIDSVSSGWDGHYSRTWSQWDDSPPVVCDWLGQAVLWSGETGPMVPLFDGDAHACDPNGTYQVGTTLTVEYEPMVAPFVLTGRILSDDQPAQLEASVALRGPVPNATDSLEHVVSDEQGVYRFETMDPRQRYAWCHVISVDLLDSPGPASADLSEVSDMAACGGGRRFPDIRFGSDKAVNGTLQILVNSALGLYRRAGEGEGTVTLLDPSDSTVVLGPVETLDDGSFHMWWPAEVGQEKFPGCDWLLQIELTDGRSVVEPLLDWGQNCHPDVERLVSM